jgi:O-antigen/teichoic acid export membrane protein
MFPAAIGMIVVAEPLYTVFYQHSDLGTLMTQISAVMSIFVALYAVLGNVLQAVNQKRSAIWALFWGFVAKIITQPLFIAFTGPAGMLYSTMIGFAITCWMMFKIMHDTTHFSGVRLWRRSLLLLLMSLVMGVITGVAKIGLGFILNYEDRMHSLIALTILAAIGIIVYGYCVLRTRVADQLIGGQAARVRRKLRLS